MIKPAPEDVPQEISFDSGNQLDLIDNRTLKSQPNGITINIFLKKRAHKIKTFLT